MSRTIEITAVYYGQKFSFGEGDNQVIIGEADYVAGELPDGVGKFFAIKGPPGMRTRQTYRLYGRWSSYRNRRTGQTEQQFHYQTFTESAPASRAGVITYLKKAGEGCGVGQVKAARLWERFGHDAIRICRESPDVAAAAIKGLSLEQAEDLAAKLAKSAHVEECTVELLELLNARGFPRATAKRAMDIWGNVAASRIKANPYVLMAFRGCGFKRCDSMYLDLGLDPARLKRQALCAWYAIASDSNGHTWFPRPVAVNGIRSSVAGAEIDEDKALQLAVRAGALSSQVDRDGRTWFAEGQKHRNEAFIARCLADAGAESHHWPMDYPDGPSNHQLEILAAATSGTIGILGGGPGTGKTFTAAALIRGLIEDGHEDGIAVAAPTGKAAVRITEALVSYGIHKRARTIHSLLKIGPSGDGMSFEFGLGNPLPFRFIIVDESSMIDTDLMSALLAARSPGCHILFVGDVYQLPPVGHGAPLRDMIDAGLPYGELREVRRNSGAIVQACADMREARPFAVHSEHGEGNLVHVPASEPSLQKQKILQLCEQWRKAGLDPVWDCQVLCAVNARSDLSRKELNKLLQAELNTQPGVDGSPFRRGDKIVNTRNGFYPMAGPTDDGLGVERRTAVIYEMFDPRSPGSIRYVGVTSQGLENRLEQHLRRPSAAVRSWISELKLDGIAPAIRQIAPVPPKHDANQAEVRWIEKRRSEGHPLLNVQDGGNADVNDKGDVYVANGELAEVVEAAPTYTIAKLSNPERTIKIPRGQGSDDRDDDSEADDRAPNTGCSWDLGYALSCHKSQGSEWPVVIVAIDEYPGARRICSREWIFTAISRAKRACYLVGNIATARRFANQPRLHERKTFLVEWIKREQCQLMLAEL